MRKWEREKKKETEIAYALHKYNTNVLKKINALRLVVFVSLVE